jgi:RNase P subunit RPR2
LKIISFNIGRTTKAFEEGVLESRHIILRSLDLILNHNETAFYKVISAQLRLLICDNDNSLLPRLNKKIDLYKLNELEELTPGYKRVNPTEMFNKNERVESLEEWLNQPLIIINNKVSFPKHIKCKYCSKVNSTQHNETMELKVTKNAELLSFTCSECNKKVNDYDVTKIHLETEEENIVYFDEEKKLTIKKLIRGYADKNGGAHLDPTLDLDSFFGVRLGEEYLIGLSFYIVEQINKLKLE